MGKTPPATCVAWARLFNSSVSLGATPTSVTALKPSEALVPGEGQQTAPLPMASWKRRRHPFWEQESPVLLAKFRALSEVWGQRKAGKAWATTTA